MNSGIFRNIASFLMLLLSLTGFSQQGILLKPLETDSTQMEFERQLEYRQLISGSPESDFFTGDNSISKFDERLEFDKRYSFNLDFNAINGNTFTAISTGDGIPFHTPFYHNGMVLSEAAYQLGNRFVLGGFSYGANSVFSAPFPNPGYGNFDSYGSTLFMQYKVSKKVKIQTRVNVSQGHYPEF